MANKYSISAIFKAVDQFSSPVKRMQAVNKTLIGGLRTDLAKTQRAWGNFTQNFSNGIKTGMLVGAGLAVYGLANMAKTGIQLASDLTEVQNVVDKTFTDNSKIIDDWSKTAINKFGLSELQAKKFNGTMGALLKSSGITGDSLVSMSTDLSGLSGDFASFYNLDHQEAFDKLRSGISGETEPLKSLGINMSVANLEAFALSQGITKAWKAMTQAEQVQLRYNYIMKASKDAQGDFNDTLSTSYANQQRVFKNNLDSLSATIMKKLLPMLTEGFKKMNEFISSIDGEKLGNSVVSIVKGLMEFGKIVVTIVKFLIPFAPLIISIVAAIALYKAVLLVATIAQWAMNVAMTANPIGIIIVAIGILIGLIVLLVMNWDTVSKAVIDFYEKNKTWIAFVLPGLVLFIEILKVVIKNWDLIKTTVVTVWTAVSDGVKGAIAWVVDFGKQIFSFLITPLQIFLNLVSKIPGVGDLTAGFAEKINKLKMDLNTTETKQQQPISTMNPYERSIYSKEEKSTNNKLTIEDKSGKAKMTTPYDPNVYKMKTLKSGAF